MYRVLKNIFLLDGNKTVKVVLTEDELRECKDDLRERKEKLKSEKCKYLYFSTYLRAHFMSHLLSQVNLSGVCM